jgi:DNA-binding HxlR family transcriptional regulator
MKQIPVWCEGNEWCAITATAKLIGKKWHPVIVHRLLEGDKGFNELKRDVDGVTAKVLSESLEDLQEHGLVRREVVSEKPKQVSYSLTESGRSLEPIISEMKGWADDHLVQQVSAE